MVPYGPKWFVTILDNPRYEIDDILAIGYSNRVEDYEKFDSAVDIFGFVSYCTSNNVYNFSIRFNWFQGR